MDVGNNETIIVNMDPYEIFDSVIETLKDLASKLERDN